MIRWAPHRCYRYFATLACMICSINAIGQTPWKRHTIDDQFRGADGVRLADYNGDGRPDVVTGWEESGVIRLYLQPDSASLTKPWPSVSVAQVRSPEDAVPADLDGDGKLDIVSCHEGKQRQLVVHWNDADANDDLLDASSWSSTRFKQLDGQLWMFALPLGKLESQIALVVGSKGKNASITLLLSPSAPSRDLSDWRTLRLRDAGWIMSLRSVDMDDDGDRDVVFSDRKGNRRMAGWLEQPDDLMQPWIEHPIAGQDKEPMFLSATSGQVVVATRNDAFLDCVRMGQTWRITKIAHPEGVKFGKAIEPLGKGQIVMSCNTHAGPIKDRPGLWLRSVDGNWSAIDPTTHVKFDRMELLDLDSDGDLDVMTCEERQNLGVIWYENPSS